MGGEVQFDFLINVYMIRKANIDDHNIPKNPGNPPLYPPSLAGGTEGGGEYLCSAGSIEKS